MLILGIHDGHDCSAAVMKNGRTIAAAQEERFSSIKNDSGYPTRAIEFCMKQAGITAADLDIVALSSFWLNPILNYVKRYATFSVQDWVDEQTLFWKPKLLEGKNPCYLDVYKDRGLQVDAKYNYDGIIRGYGDSEEAKVFLERRLDYVSAALGVERDRIHVKNHEQCHKCYALFGSPFRNEKVLILTAEGLGDDYNGTVSVYDNGEIFSLCNMKQNQLGVVYRFVTLMLGMKPFQHEYKVMGMAPYANSYETRKAYEVLRNIFQVDGMEIKFKDKPADLFFAIRDALLGCRFDGMAGAVQQMLEEILCQWVSNCVAESGVRKVVLAGGIAQNIKAMKCVSELSCVDDIFVAPAAGDTSNSVGAAYLAHYDTIEKSYESHESIHPVTHVYLGPEYSRDEIEEAISNEPDLDDRFEIYRDFDNAALAKRLAEGNIFGLMRGRMEFGLRSLGNRSILADPTNANVTDKINQMIKFRDFWMPFTPSMLDDRADDYIQNPKGLRSPYMTMAFESVEANRGDFVSAMHPADKTVRPQIVKEADNPNYYGLLKEFEKLTGRGVLLNTSFNLHGMPVVLGPKEAIFTLLNSGLDGLVMEDVLILRKVRSTTIRLDEREETFDARVDRAQRTLGTAAS